MRVAERRRTSREADFEPLEAAAPARGTIGTGYSRYGYEIYLPNVIRAFLSKKDGAELRGYISDSSEGRAISPVFYP